MRNILRGVAVAILLAGSVSLFPARVEAQAFVCYNERLADRDRANYEHQRCMDALWFWERRYWCDMEYRAAMHDADDAYKSCMAQLAG
jgi:hypothetical protein